MRRPTLSPPPHHLDLVPDLVDPGRLEIGLSLIHRGPSRGDPGTIDVDAVGADEAGQELDGLVGDGERHYDGGGGGGHDKAGTPSVLAEHLD